MGEARSRPAGLFNSRKRRCPMNPLLVGLLVELAKVLADWLVKWLQDKFKKAEDRLPPVDQFTSNSAHRNAVLDEALRMTPRWSIGRRGIIRWLKRHAENVQGGDTEELSELAGAAADE